MFSPPLQFYNWTRIHKTLRTTPAMAAGLTDRAWDIEEIVALMDEVAPKPDRMHLNCGRDRTAFHVTASLRIEGSRDAKAEGWVAKARKSYVAIGGSQ
jgi:hypothetical protein